ncbi:MAG: hypothetical protein A4E36_00059 [Methanoregulaceae archaeon PtaB.Bin009]|nr:MAG: hypothetical protein A4E36_00059 [Methanoregulaceae archaeon PtaB.Bin009]
MMSIPARTCASTATFTACLNGSRSPHSPEPRSTGKLPTTVVGRIGRRANGSMEDQGTRRCRSRGKRTASRMFWSPSMVMTSRSAPRPQPE